MGLANMKSFNLSTFIASSILCSILTFASLITAAARDEGTGGNGMLTIAFEKLFVVLRFPTHTLFFQFVDDPLFLSGLLINCLFYGLLIERLTAVLNWQKNDKYSRMLIYTYLTIALLPLTQIMHKRNELPNNLNDTQIHKKCEAVVDSLSKKIVYANVDSAPRFKNGLGDLIRHITKNLNTKKEWTEDELFNSTATVSFIVNKDGTPSDFYIVGKQHNEPQTDLEDRFIKIISDMPNWIPGSCGNKPVPVRTEQLIMLCLNVE